MTLGHNSKACHTWGSFDPSPFQEEEAVFHKPLKFPGRPHHGDTVFSNYLSWSSLGTGGGVQCGRKCKQRESEPGVANPGDLAAAVTEGSLPSVR